MSYTARGMKFIMEGEKSQEHTMLDPAVAQWHFSTILPQPSTGIYKEQVFVHMCVLLLAVLCLSV